MSYELRKKLQEYYYNKVYKYYIWCKQWDEEGNEEESDLNFKEYMSRQQVFEDVVAMYEGFDEVKTHLFIQQVEHYSKLRERGEIDEPRD